MSRTTVTIEWVLVFSVTYLVMGGLLMGALGDETHRAKWADLAIFLLFFAGLGMIVWQGVAGHLPGTGVSARGFFPFVARFLYWSGGLGLLVGAICALGGLLATGGNWSNRDFAIGMILMPGMFGLFTGSLVGAIVAIVKTLR